MNKRTTNIIEQNKEQITQWMNKQYPIDWICRKIGIARDTFRKLFPTYKGSQGYSILRVKSVGPLLTETRNCARCKKPFTVTGRTKSNMTYSKRFCSIACAKSREEYWKTHSTQYQTIVKKLYNPVVCCVCGFDKLFEVHHFDHNRNNNNPDNLIPLCPNHHRMIHSKLKNEILPIIEGFQRKIKTGS